MRGRTRWREPTAGEALPPTSLWRWPALLRARAWAGTTSTCRGSSSSPIFACSSPPTRTRPRVRAVQGRRGPRRFPPLTPPPTVLPVHLHAFEVPLCTVERVEVMRDAVVEVSTKDLRSVLLRVLPPYVAASTMEVLNAAAFFDDVEEQEDGPGALDAARRESIRHDCITWTAQFAEAVRQFAFGDPAKQFARAHRDALEGGSTRAGSRAPPRHSGPAQSGRGHCPSPSRTHASPASYPATRSSARRPSDGLGSGGPGTGGSFSSTASLPSGEAVVEPSRPLGEAVDGWQLFDFNREFRRQVCASLGGPQGIWDAPAWLRTHLHTCLPRFPPSPGVQGLLDERGQPVDGWRVYRNAYILSESYPFNIIVPGCMSDQEIRQVRLASYPASPVASPRCIACRPPAARLQVAKFRSRGRIPAVTWAHPWRRSVLTRSSQPRTGISARRCPADEKMLAAYGERGSSASFQIVDARHVMAVREACRRGGSGWTGAHWTSTRPPPPRAAGCGQQDEGERGGKHRPLPQHTHRLPQHWEHTHHARIAEPPGPSRGAGRVGGEVGDQG